MDALSRDRREANVAFGGSYHPQKSRRRQAPARGPAAVYSHRRPNQNETQNARPLLVGRAFVNTAPKALAAGSAGPHPLKGFIP